MYNHACLYGSDFIRLYNDRQGDKGKQQKQLINSFQ